MIGIALLVVAAVAIVVAVILLIVVIKQRILIDGLQIAVVALGVRHTYAVVLYCRQLTEFLIDAGLCSMTCDYITTNVLQHFYLRCMSTWQ